jgi:hypothetical protein
LLDTLDSASWTSSSSSSTASSQPEPVDDDIDNRETWRKASFWVDLTTFDSPISEKVALVGVVAAESEENMLERFPSLLRRTTPSPVGLKGEVTWVFWFDDTLKPRRRVE